VADAPLRVFRHGVVDSTSERAFAALASGAARDGDVHVAAGQTAGRGRLGRRWESAHGEGLFLSLVLLPARTPHPAALTPPHPAALTMAAGLALLAAVRALGLATAELDWPNDLVVPSPDATRAKLAGILVEARGFDPGRPHAVVGVGLNVRQRAFSPELASERPVTSLALCGLDVTVDAALDAVLATLPGRLELACTAPERVAADFARASGLVGRLVRVVHGRAEERGRLVALSLAGLELSGEDGRRTRVALEHAQAVEPLG
jgi:BirA family biotin operon repressor/biotin-[acetyl-CoA-carboxylase] ligase